MCRRGINVAVKQVHDGINVTDTDFADEVALMANLGQHLNIVQFYGVTKFEGNRIERDRIE